MKYLLGLLIVGLLVISACGPSAPEATNTPEPVVEKVPEVVETQPVVEKKPEPVTEPTDVVGAVAADVTDLEESLSEELDFSEFDSLADDLADLEGLDY